MQTGLTFLDLFAGAGGLSEGFIQAGFEPVAHVESDKSACFTLKTRMAYHWLKQNKKIALYADYLKGNIKRHELYTHIPESINNSVINAEIGEKTLPEIFRQIDLLLNNKSPDIIIGGPPCQAYSLVGRSRDLNRMKGDKRNYLYIYYAEFLKRYRPSYFLFENVTGLLSARDEQGISYFQTMRNLFSECGYETEYQILSAEEYGVPQSRKRIILVGKKGKSTGFYPQPERCRPEVSVQDIFSDFPPLQAGEGNPGSCILQHSAHDWLYQTGIRNDEIPVTWHQARPNTERDLEIYHIAVDLWNKNRERLNYNSLPDHLKTHKNRKSFTDRFKVVASDLPCSHTVVAHIAKDGHYYIHPDIKQNRSITPREAARLQTFPDDYYFENVTEIPGRTAAFRQIGNAVPVLLSHKIAESMKINWK